MLGMQGGFSQPITATLLAARARGVPCLVTRTTQIAKSLLQQKVDWECAESQMYILVEGLLCVHCPCEWGTSKDPYRSGRDQRYIRQASTAWLPITRSLNTTPLRRKRCSEISLALPGTVTGLLARGLTTSFGPLLCAALRHSRGDEGYHALHIQRKHDSSNEESPLYGDRELNEIFGPLPVILLSLLQPVPGPGWSSKSSVWRSWPPGSTKLRSSSHAVRPAHQCQVSSTCRLPNERMLQR